MKCRDGVDRSLGLIIENKIFKIKYFFKCFYFGKRGKMLKFWKFSSKSWRLDILGFSVGWSNTKLFTYWPA